MKRAEEVKARKAKKPRVFKTPPRFKPESWSNTRIEAGCYPYALNLDEKEFVLVGDYIGQRCTKNTPFEKVIAVFLEETSYLGIKAKVVNEKYHLEEGERLIYLWHSRMLGYYHFIRQDDSGKWSDKHPGEVPNLVDFWGEHYAKPGDRFEEGVFFALKKSR